MSVMASQITGITIVYTTVCSDANQRRHRSSASLAFVRAIHQWPVNSPHKGPAMRKRFHVMTSSWSCLSNHKNTFSSSNLYRHVDVTRDWNPSLRKTMICLSSIANIIPTGGLVTTQGARVSATMVYWPNSPGLSRPLHWMVIYKYLTYIKFDEVDWISKLLEMCVPSPTNRTLYSATKSPLGWLAYTRF